MKLKKFVYINMSLSILLVGSLFLISYINVNYIYSYSSKFLKLEKNEKIKDLKIVNVGSSHTFNGIEYPKNIKGYNFGLPSQKFYYDYEILKKYKKRLGENCIVIIPISIFSFYDGLKTEKIDKNYACFLEKNRILHLRNDEYFMLKYFSITQPITRIPKVLKQISLFIQDKELFASKVLTLEEIKQDSTNKVKDHLKREDKSNKIGINQLKEILDFCIENDYKPILITTPFTYLYNNGIGVENYQERIYKNLEKIKKQYQEKYIYLDYSHDKRFENNLEYFRDSDHLNGKGAEYFTEILLKDIEKELKNERKI